ncbi:Vi polysaccharide biosynthesis protein VipA/TviB [Arcticibacterium luteifluviistationis]|uniref:Vi polysaccharide biosynthesis protein VipA/TviB n=1 Tax=Arcticibacterium luteifluviistationis TaxID=1784714 RepID=A0A2Z4GIK6_9BACT|nr:Vi polysaccharide biosynthesis protein VipA/TviB [Arcticibacterium luteifluviistationis]
MQVVIVGLGYVGLPTAVAFSKKYKTTGVDVNNRRIDELKKGVDSKTNFSSEQLSNNLDLIFQKRLPHFEEQTVFIVTVPTPVTGNKEPDLSFLNKASNEIALVLKKGDLVIYESTTFPGCTEEVCVPILESVSKLKLNIDFGVGYSPERYSPGETKSIESIVRVTSGSSPEVAKMVDSLYSSIMVVETYLAPSIKVAEAAKLVENCQRDVNISFVNELALIFDKMGIETNEVLNAAKTKWNFLDFKPGLVGGHCISVDPYYMIHKANALGYNPKLIGAGREVNEEMGKFAAHKAMKIIVSKGLNLIGLRILVLGFAYKENCSDFRNTKALDLINELKDFGALVSVYDPLVDKKSVLNETGIEILENVELETYAVTIVAVDHIEFKQLNIDKRSLFNVHLFA